MTAPLLIPSDVTPVSTVWRAISSLRLVRRLLGNPERKPVLASVAGEADTKPDTSLTQAELEVLK